MNLRQVLAILLASVSLWIGLFMNSICCSGQALAEANRTSEKTMDRIVAVVNGKVITLSELKEAMAQIRLGLSLPGMLTVPTVNAVNPKAVSFEREVLNHLIEREMQFQHAQRQGIRVSSNEVNQLLREIRDKNGLYTDAVFQNALIQENLTLKQYTQDLKKQLMILKLANQEVNSGILLDEKELREYYSNHLGQFSLPDEVHLRQILLEIARPELKESVTQKAARIAEELENGADFLSLARQYAQDTGSGGTHDLGFVKKDQILPIVKETIRDLKAGGISAPVETSLGIHIFQVLEIRTGQHKPFEEVASLIREKLFQERAKERYHEWLQDIRNTAQVNIKVLF